MLIGPGQAGLRASCPLFLVPDPSPKINVVPLLSEDYNLAKERTPFQFASMSLSRLAELDVYDECYVYLYCDPRHIAGWTQEVEYDTFDPIHSKDGVDFVQEYLRGVASCSLDTLAASIFYVGKGRHLRSHEHLEKVSKMCHRFLKTGGPKWPKEVEEMRRWAVVCVHVKVAPP